MDSCKVCGAKIGAEDVRCTNCGHPAMKHDDKLGIQAEDGQDIDIVQAKEENSRLRHWNRTPGNRLPIGRRGRARDRSRKGKFLNAYAKQIEGYWEQLDEQLDIIPTTSDRHASKGLGQVLLESMSAIGNLLACYQDTATHESKLDTDDKQRISGIEQRTQAKLESLVLFCDTTNERARTELGLTDSDVQRLRKSTLDMLRVIDGDVRK